MPVDHSRWYEEDSLLIHFATSRSARILVHFPRVALSELSAKYQIRSQGGGKMIRRAAAVVLALALNPAMLRAQDTVFTVNVASAEVYKGPSTGNPVIGHASGGTVLTVMRNLGSWIRVAWPDAPDGVGYIHVSTGKLGAPGANPPLTRTPGQASSAPAQAPGPASAPAPPATSPVTRGPASQPAAARRPISVTPAEHTVGIGALMGTMSTYGATARTWPNNHVGIQLGFTRDSMTSDLSADRMTSMQFEPGVVYGFVDRVTDYVWIRPYVGSTVSFRHQTLKLADPAATPPAAENGMGYRFFGGTELMFASLPRLGLSADVGYRKLPAPFAGFDADPLSLTIAGHWYMK
jgi:hypothetical protein